LLINSYFVQVLDLLKCSLLSKSCLTDLLLERKPTIHKSTFFSHSVENNSSIKLTLKLVIRKSDGKILFAQGDKDFADMVLSFLSFPLGGVVRKLGGNSCVGRIDGLYKSIADIKENVYFMSKAANNRVVDPHLLPLFKLRTQILPILRPSFLQYYCHYENFHKGNIHALIFKASENRSSGRVLREMVLLYPETPIESVEGFVKDPALYVVMDVLVVEPFSPISALNLLNRLNTPFSDPEEKVVTIGLKEV